MISSGVHGCILHTERPVSSTHRARMYAEAVRASHVASRASSAASDCSSSSAQTCCALGAYRGGDLVGLKERPRTASTMYSSSSDEYSTMSYRLPAVKCLVLKSMYTYHAGSAVCPLCCHLMTTDLHQQPSRQRSSRSPTRARSSRTS